MQRDSALDSTKTGKQSSTLHTQTRRVTRLHGTEARQRVYNLVMHDEEDVAGGVGSVPGSLDLPAFLENLADGKEKEPRLADKRKKKRGTDGDGSVPVTRSPAAKSVREKTARKEEAMDAQEADEDAVEEKKKPKPNKAAAALSSNLKEKSMAAKAAKSEPIEEASGDALSVDKSAWAKLGLGKNKLVEASHLNLTAKKRTGSMHTGTVQEDLHRSCQRTAHTQEDAEFCSRILAANRDLASFVGPSGELPLHALCSAIGHTVHSVEICRALLKAHRGAALVRWKPPESEFQALPIHLLCRHRVPSAHSAEICNLLLCGLEETTNVPCGGVLPISIVVEDHPHVSEHHATMFRQMLQSNKDALKLRDRTGRTIAHRLCLSTKTRKHSENMVECLRLILESIKRSVDLDDNMSCKLLHVLCMSTNPTQYTVAICDMLVQAAPDAVYHKDDEGMLPLHHLLKNEILNESSADMCRKLLEAYPKGASVANKKGYTGKKGLLCSTKNRRACGGEAYRAEVAARRISEPIIQSIIHGLQEILQSVRIIDFEIQRAAASAQLASPPRAPISGPYELTLNHTHSAALCMCFTGTKQFFSGLRSPDFPLQQERTRSYRQEVPTTAPYFVLCNASAPKRNAIRRGHL